MMLLTWVFTVDSASTRRSAISALVSPSAIRASTSSSRSVSSAPGGTGAVSACIRTSATSGARVGTPACVCLMAFASSPADTFFST